MGGYRSDQKLMCLPLEVVDMVVGDVMEASFELPPAEFLRETLKFGCSGERVSTLNKTMSR